MWLQPPWCLLVHTPCHFVSLGLRKGCWISQKNSLAFSSPKGKNLAMVNASQSLGPLLHWGWECSVALECIFIRKHSCGAGTKIRRVKSWPHKREHPSLIFSTCEKLGAAVFDYNSSAARVPETGRPRELAGYLSSLISKLQTQQETLSLKPKWKLTKEDICCWPLSSICMYTYVYIHSPTHIWTLASPPPERWRGHYPKDESN